MSSEAPFEADEPFSAPISLSDVAADVEGPRIVLINDCRDQISFGSQSLADGLLRILANQIPDGRVTPIPSHWLVDATYGLSGYVRGGAGFRPPEAVFPAVADQFETVAHQWLAGTGGGGAARFLERFDGADVVVLNGEGSIYRQNLSAIRELFLAWFAKVHLGIPTAFLNGSLHLTGVVPILPAMVRKTFRELDAVVMREPWSLRNMQEYVPGVAARVIPDAAYAFSLDDAREGEAVRALSRSLDGEPYFCFDPGAMPVDVLGGERSAVYELVRKLQATGLRSVFVSNMPADDYIAGIAEATESIYVDTIRDYHEFMVLLERAQFLVSGRHHNLILATIAGCPTVPFGTVTHKVHGACEMLDGLVGVPFDGTDIRPHIHEIENAAMTYVGDRDGYRRRLLGLASRRRSEAMELGTLVRSLLPKRDGAV